VVREGRAEPFPAADPRAGFVARDRRVVVVVVVPDEDVFERVEKAAPA
jgi:hypothetical protein